jgi:hypothetical protein
VGGLRRSGRWAGSCREGTTAQARHRDPGHRNAELEWVDRQILRIRPEQKILILTITDEEQVVREVLEAGARGFVLKSDAARDLVAAVEALQAGTTFFTSRIGEMVLRAYLDKGRGGSERVPDLSSLTSRERADGATSRRGKEHERGRLPLRLERKEGREAAIQHRAQTRIPLHERVGPLCGSEPHHPGSGWPTMTSISLQLESGLKLPSRSPSSNNVLCLRTITCPCGAADRGALHA